MRAVGDALEPSHGAAPYRPDRDGLVWYSGSLRGSRCSGPIRKGQLAISGVLSHRPAEQFYALAA